MWKILSYPAQAVARPAPSVAPRIPRRGLGLFDAMLAIAVLSVLGLWGGQIVGDWTRGRVVAGEARGVVELARAGRLLVEGEITHARRSHGVGAAPLDVPLADLEAAGLRAPALGNRTPGRRDLSLWLFRPSDGAVLVIARARGESSPPRLVGAEDGVIGVGQLLAGDTRLRGPGVDFDMGPINAVAPGFATVNDLFALDYVALDVTCRAYLYRQRVDCDGDGADDAEAHTMTVDLEMDGHNLTGAGDIQTTTARITTLNGTTTVTAPLTVDGDLAVTGNTDLQTLDVSGALTATTLEATRSLTVPNLTAMGQIIGEDLILDGTVTVSGEARLGDADVNTLTVETLNVRQLSSDTATIGEIFAEDVTATRCRGCTP